MKDIRFQGLRFTWNRGSLFERLNRVLCNYDWEVLASTIMVHHLHKIKSDHRLLALCFGKNSFLNRPVRLDFLVGGLLIVTLATLLKIIECILSCWKGP